MGDQILKMVQPGDAEDPNKPKAIFTEKPHITWDNFFSGDQTMEYCASKGLVITCTVNRGRLPGKVPAQYWHKTKLNAYSDDRCKAARFENPIVAVKRNKAKWKTDAVWVHTSFQSTGACNIAHVNALNTCSLYAQKKERGHALFKRQWAIEMKDSRQLYLNTYGKVDKIDHYIKNCNMTYRYECCSCRLWLLLTLLTFFSSFNHRSWKYWHAPMNHGKALAVTTAYDMYLECCEGNLNGDWKVPKPVDFHQFREKLGMQMMQYDPRKRLYLGDDKFRVCTQQN